MKKKQLKTDLNAIVGLRDGSIIKAFEGEDFSNYPFMFHLARYLYVASIDNYMVIGRKRGLAHFLIRRLFDELEGLMKNHPDRKKWTIKLKREIKESPDKYPPILRRFILSGSPNSKRMYDDLQDSLIFLSETQAKIEFEDGYQD